MARLLDRILRAGEGRKLRKLERISERVTALEPEMEALTDAELREQTDLFKERLADGETLDDILPEAFATVREAARRTIGQRPFDVQVMGGAALHWGDIAEMKTGEGKTLVATMPSYLNALEGKGVHVVTVNDYLASYQSELMGRIYRFLGLTVGCIVTGQTPEVRRQQYNADITYGTNNEFGFDYLRDNMAWKPEEMVQRGHHFAIVDEVDSILIDEARTPLIISGPAEGDANRWYSEFARIVTRLRKDTDYEVDEKKRTVGVLEPGIDKVEDALGIDNLYESLNTPLIGYLNNAIKAKELFERDRDYVVLNGEVLIVDEHTGRVLPGRRYNEGMHQAIEAKEGVEIKAENQTLATITLQNYFRLYDKLSGMTGTAETEAEEFANTYELGVVPIPTNKPMIRQDRTDLIYPTRQGKLRAVVNDIAERHEKGQPILVGTASVEASEELSNLLDKAGIPHSVLNAKQHEREAKVVAEAGRKGAVTVATNMAGRGTDIMLGGNPEHRAQEALLKRGLSPEETPEEYEAAWPEELERQRAEVAAEHDEVVELGGLYVLGSERHESRRIDNQLRGRSGRQGDPGESRFYLSLEDDLMRLFAGGVAGRMLEAASDDDTPIENKSIAKTVRRAQGSIESRNAEMRKNVLKYDDVMNDQRTEVYSTRRRILEGEDIEDMVSGFLDFVVQDVVDSHIVGVPEEEWDLDALWNDLKGYYTPGFTAEELMDDAGVSLDRETLLRELKEDIHAHYEEREVQVGSDKMREIERQIVLSVLDRKWREHLYEMDYLKEGIGLRAMAQRDPLVEYKDEGYQMFQAMDANIRSESVRYLFHFELPEERAARLQRQATEIQAAMDAQRAGRAAFQARKEAAERLAAGASAEGTATGSGQQGRIDPAQLGIKVGSRQQNVSYSSAAKDGSGEAETQSASGKRRVGAPATAGQSAAQRAAVSGGNRAQRRAAKRAAKRRR
ncbi:preprotein translocase subunit SecA [Actinobaculum suis]|uniref:Protein translocase subunit SecA n=1 Tax=Actinobaculum suis TaxID=1657 RepID=A0A0K9ET29_9ACTO|nr:preprotein translocase subunit SecA [Actinobaculum suis]KMY22981.1 preprotein translocase subunit SecA [Actinobaculum suis]MDY5152952.1 preprotein translocase subunit SecA [Actinobaculum suis]SDE36630.1 preprotein translocase subunit SecA [Actinobaculum suis]